MHVAHVSSWRPWMLLVRAALTPGMRDPPPSSSTAPSWSAVISLRSRRRASGSEVLSKNGPARASKSTRDMRLRKSTPPCSSSTLMCASEFALSTAFNLLTCTSQRGSIRGSHLALPSPLSDVHHRVQQCEAVLCDALSTALNLYVTETDDNEILRTVALNSSAGHHGIAQWRIGTQHRMLLSGGEDMLQHIASAGCVCAMDWISETQQHGRLAIFTR